MPNIMRPNQKYDFLNFNEMLEDTITQKMMRADGVKPVELAKLLKKIRTKLHNI